MALNRTELLGLVKMADAYEKREKKRRLFSFLPNPKQQEFIRLDNKIRLFFGGNQCIEENEYVYASDRILKVKDIQNGDKILGGEVKNLFTFEDDLYQITFSNGIKIKVNKDHPFFWKKWRYQKGEWKKLSDINKGFVQFIKSENIGDVVNGNESSLKDFVKGCFNGDGYLLIRKRENRTPLPEIGFCIGISERKAYEMQYILWKLGILSFVRKEFFKTSKQFFYRVKVNSKDTNKLIDFLDWTKYPDKFKKAKKLTVSHRKSIDGWIGVRNIKKIGRGNVVGFETDNHEIISYSGMRTHNCGKTTVGILELIAFCLGFRPWLESSNKNYKTPFQPPIRARVFGEDFTNHVGKVLVEKLREWLPENEVVEVKKNQQGVQTFWKLKNGSTIEFLSYEMDSAKLEGWVGHVAYFDEPPPRSHYIATQRGLVRNMGYCWLTLTPLKEPWLYDELWLKRGERIGGISVNIRDNVGYGLTEEGVKMFEEGLTQDEKAARIDGEFTFMSGLIYKEFNANVHIIPPFDPKHLSIYEAIDPHPRTPHAVMWVGVDANGRKYIIDEIFSHCVINELAQQIQIKRVKEPIFTLIDPSAVIKDPVNNTSIIDRLLELGIYTEKGSKDLVSGIQRVKRALEIKEDNFGTSSEIYIFSSCKRTIWEFQHYCWDEYRGKDRGEKNRPIDKDDHFMENLRRILLREPEYVEDGEKAEIYIPN